MSLHPRHLMVLFSFHGPRCGSPAQAVSSGKPALSVARQREVEGPALSLPKGACRRVQNDRTGNGEAVRLKTLTVRQKVVY